jgi:hypothetical protein
VTKLLEQAVAKAGTLSEAEQDAIAQIVIDEIESERRWDEAIAKSPEKLGKLADKAWAEHEIRKTVAARGSVVCQDQQRLSGDRSASH